MQRRGENIMGNGDELFIRAKEIETTLGVSSSYAYKVIETLNNELEKLGCYTISGRTSRKYFHEKFYDLRVVK